MITFVLKRTPPYKSGDVPIILFINNVIISDDSQNIVT